MALTCISSIRDSAHRHEFPTIAFVYNASSVWKSRTLCVVVSVNTLKSGSETFQFVVARYEKRFFVPTLSGPVTHEVKLTGYCLTYANTKVIEEDMRDLDVRARVSSRTVEELPDVSDSRSK